MIGLTEYMLLIAVTGAVATAGAAFLAYQIGRTPNAYTERCLRRTIEAHEGTIANLDDLLAATKIQRQAALAEAGHFRRRHAGLQAELAVQDATIRELSAKLAAAEAKLPVRAERGRFVSRRVANDQTQQAAE